MKRPNIKDLTYSKSCNIVTMYFFFFFTSNKKEGSIAAPPK
jgi:hypothetical protein